MININSSNSMVNMPTNCGMKGMHENNTAKLNNNTDEATMKLHAQHKQHHNEVKNENLGNKLDVKA